jgi:pimeloyl-ACP methyl ester carboxylesterase
VTKAPGLEPRRIVAAPLAHWRWDASGAGRGHAVLLHGIGGGSAAWADGLAATGSALAAVGVTALAVDLPGYGDSPAIVPLTMAAMADRVAALIATLPGQRAVVVGHSMGGMVAQELVATRPALVTALVLLGTSSAFGKPGGEWQAEFLRQRFAPLDGGLGMAALADELVGAMAGSAADPTRQQRARDLMAAVAESTYRQALTALVGFDRRADLARIEVPTLVVTGDQDRTAPADVARRMAERISAAEFVVVAGLGHLGPMLSPDAFNALMLDFLARRVFAHSELDR